MEDIFNELLQAARDKRQHAIIKRYLTDLSFSVLPLTENVGHRALVYVEEYGLSSGMRAGDAIVAATATENGLTLATGNARHFRPVKGLALKIFRPPPGSGRGSRGSRAGASAGGAGIPE